MRNGTDHSRQGESVINRLLHRLAELRGVSSYAFQTICVL